MTIGPKAGERVGTPVRGCVICIEELAFTRIGKFARIHGLVANFVAMHSEINLGRCEIHINDPFRNELRGSKPGRSHHSAFHSGLRDLHFVTVTVHRLRRTNCSLAGFCRCRFI